MKMIWIKRCASLMAVSAVAACFGGCSHEHETVATDEHGDHEHGAEARTVQITVFGKRHEIFAEHPVPVAGNATKFVTHVTHLDSFEPRREGPIRFIMQLGQEAPIEQVAKAPARPGIYEPALTFPKAGDWNISVVVPDNQGEETIAFPLLKVFPDAEAAEQAQVSEPPEGISFLKEQQWKVGTRTEPVGKRELVEQLRLPGTVTARPGSLARVTPPMPGRLLLPADQPMPIVGDKVKAGQVLALIEPSFSEIAARFVEAEAEVARTRLALQQAELALQRVEKLAKAEAKSGRELQEAEFAHKSAKAQYDAALSLQATYRQATTNLDSQDTGTNQPVIELRSPIAGTIVAQSGAAVGEYITGEKAAFTVLDPATVFIQAHVPEGSIQRLGKTMSASYELPAQPGEFVPITGDAAGRLVFVGIEVDPDTRTVPLVYEATNATNRLRVGQSLNLFVETARTEEAIALPNQAIVEEAGRPIAFVQVGGETFEKRDLTLGIRDANWVQVLSGVAEGERIVTEGAYAVRLASVSSAIPSHGHAH